MSSNAVSSNPLTPLYEFVRSHLAVFNGVMLASGTLVAVLDFLAPRVSLLPKIVYSTTFGIVLLMILAALAPALVTRALYAAGVAARRDDRVPLWSKPLWQAAVVVLGVVTLVGFASLARAGQGGLLASQSTTVRGWQESVLSMRGDVADIGAGLRQANARLDQIAADSRDPQKELASRGYAFDDNGLMQAIRQADSRALGFFTAAGYRAIHEGPLAVLLNGDHPWDAQIAASLPRTMFASRDACKAGALLQYELKAPAVERVNAFKRLCDPTQAAEVIEAAVRRDDASAPLNEQQTRERAARKANLALLKS